MNDNINIKRLLKLIEDQLVWGDSSTWVSQDFEELNILIQEKTKMSISASTLRRLWGKTDYKNQPSLTTLNTLSKLAGFKNWKDYTVNHGTNPALSIKPVKLRNIKNTWVIGGIAIFITLIVVLALKIIQVSLKIAPVDNYSFNSHAITRDLPNTVVFNYNVEHAATDSVFIQQSWDNSKRVKVDKRTEVFNSIYYKPGFYHAKLTVGNQIVKERSLLIPTSGWLGLIDQIPIPVYLKKVEFLTTNGIEIHSSTFVAHNIQLEPEPPTAEFYNTGNFKAVPINDFTFSTEVRDNYKEGASRCQEIHIVLYTDDIPISVPLAKPGCFAGLTLLDGKNEIKGTINDLAGFGVDPSNWVKVLLRGKKNKLDIMINGKMAYQIIISGRSSKILGMGFIFEGGGAVRKINLISGTTKVFSDFNQL